MSFRLREMIEADIRPIDDSRNDGLGTEHTFEWIGLCGSPFRHKQLREQNV